MPDDVDAEFQRIASQFDTPQRPTLAFRVGRAIGWVVVLTFLIAPTLVVALLVKALLS